jgi:dolichyl-phosphate beta-glucosyltransferase
MMGDVRPEVSIVIPAYNEEARLPRTIQRVKAFLDGRPHEIVVVDDGSRDRTVVAAQDVAGPGLVLVRNEENRGKGHAVRRGMLAARGERRLFSDADLSTPIEELGRLEACLDVGHDVAIGSRAMRGARVEVRQPWYRENVGRAFNVFVRALALPGLRDTQCGFKLFSARAADAVFGAARLDGFSFDVEALYIARQLGYRIAEVPVVWRNDAATRVGLLGGFQAFPDLLRIRLNDWRGYYDPGPEVAGGRAAL